MGIVAHKLAQHVIIATVQSIYCLINPIACIPIWPIIPEAALNSIHYFFVTGNG
jgi:hypothetical protein